VEVVPQPRPFDLAPQPLQVEAVSIAFKHTMITCILNYSSYHFNNKVQKPCSSIESIYGFLEKNMSVMKVVKNHAKLYILSLP
jgi:hypothetical protein